MIQMTTRIKRIMVPLLGDLQKIPTSSSLSLIEIVKTSKYIYRSEHDGGKSFKDYQ
jgi:hypothetical protein